MVVAQIWSEIMRFIFSIITVLGLILAGFSIYEHRLARDYRMRVKVVQMGLSVEAEKEVADVHRQGAVFTGQTFGDAMSPMLDGIDAIERGWLLVTAAGDIIFLAGVAGLIMTRKQNVRQVTSERPAGAKLI
jgi:hypothetical protein